MLINVNGAGFESGNDAFVVGKTMPLLQDATTTNAWAAWAVEYRDVVVLDAAGLKRGVLNLTSNDLSVAANRAAMKRLLLDARN